MWIAARFLERLISTDAFLATHVNAGKFESRKQNRWKIKSAELKQEVEQSSTFTLTSDLSYIASTLFANVNFMHVRT